MQDNIHLLYKELARKLNKYVEKKFLSDKVTVDEHSMSYFFKLMRRLFLHYSDGDFGPVVCVVFKLVSGDGDYHVEILLMNHLEEMIEIEDENISRIVGSMYAKELMKAKQGNEGITLTWKQITDFENKINEKTKRKK